MRPALVCGLLIGPALARAEPDAAHAPGFVLIDHHDGSSVAGGDLTYVATEGLIDNLTVLRLQLGGRYVDPQRQLGGYVHLPVAYASDDEGTLTALGNLELGGILLPKLGTRSTALVLHAGLALPTAPDSEDGLANLFGVAARPQDLYLALPETTSLRLGASAMFRNANVFGRVDLGLDLGLDSAVANLDPMLRLNAGLGVELGSVAVMGELANAYLMVDELDFAQRLTNVVALSARYHAGPALPYASLTIPLDDNAGGGMDFALTAGVEARL